MPGDPFAVTAQLAQQGQGAYGQALQQIAGSIAQRAQQEREQKRQILGTLLGHFITEGYITPSTDLLKNIQSVFPEVGALQITTPTDASSKPVPEGYERTIKYGKLGKVEGYEDKPIDPIKQAEEKRKSQEFPVKQAKDIADVAEKRQKTFREVRGSLFQKGAGTPTEEIAQRAMQQEALSKLPYGLGNLPWLKALAPHFMPKAPESAVQGYITKTTGIPQPKLGQTQTSEVHDFPDEESVTKANLPGGTKVRVGGKDFIWQVD